MNEPEARLFLKNELARYRRRSYTDLTALINESSTDIRLAPSGAQYQIEVEAFCKAKGWGQAFDSSILIQSHVMQTSGNPGEAFSTYD